MKTSLTVAAAVVVCTGAALAQADRVPQGCYADPETTGALPSDPRSLFLPGERLSRADMHLPAESWQAEARENFEQRRQDLLACGVD